MSAGLLAHALEARVVVPAALLALLLAWQRLRPRRGDGVAAPRQWRNVALALLASAAAYLLVPVTTVAFAASLGADGAGLFNRIGLPWPLELALGIVLLDLAIYWQHRAFHRVRWLWRLHRVHHSDTAFDATLGLRFHPGEIVLSLLYKLLLIAVFGFAPTTVLVYELLLVCFSLFTHADIALPAAWERALRRVVVTPDWHRVHHSTHRRETDSNFGNLLSAWDRAFASDVAEPVDGHARMRIGLHEFRDADAQTLAALLYQPLRGAPRTPPAR
jgi:sterol desaturase/sphingolipid hydroxylase (fatty acid hydroxylase superfamily)